MEIDYSQPIIIDNPTEQQLHDLGLEYHKLSEEKRRLIYEIKQIDLKLTKLQLAKNEDGEYIFRVTTLIT